MPFQQKLRVTFTQFRIYSNRRLLSSTSKLIFKMTVGGATIDLTAAPIRVTAPSTNAFPTPPSAEAVFEVAPDQHLDIAAEAWDIHKDGKKDELGRFTFRIWSPDLTQTVDSGTLRLIRKDGAKEIRHVDVEFKVEYESESGAWGKLGPNAVFAARTLRDGVSYAVVGGGEAVRVEVCPFRPCLDDEAMAARKRPVPVGSPWRIAAPDGKIAPDAPINVIANPAVIPIIPAVRVDRNTAARIEVTYYHPASLAFTEDDRRLEWTATSANGGAVRFFDGAPLREKGFGRSVMVYGVTEGEVTLEVRYVARGSSRLVAKYRALVKPIGRVRYRANILFVRGDLLGNGTTVRAPATTAAHVGDHVAVANRLLRQAGIELVPDADATVTGGATPTTHRGVFEVDVSDRPGLTRNLPLESCESSRLNARAGVVSIVYVHLPTKGETLGVATDFPASGHGSATITDAGSPSHSWRAPTGVPPDAEAGTHSMGVFHTGRGSATTRAFLVFDTNGWHTEATTQLNTSDVARKDFLADPNYAKYSGIDNFHDFGLLLFSDWTEAEWTAAYAEAQATPGGQVSLMSPKAQLTVTTFDFEGFKERLNEERRVRFEHKYAFNPNEPWTEAQWRAARANVTPPAVSGPDGPVGRLTFGSTIAHELCHTLNLRHRHEEGCDGVKFPTQKVNLMSYGGPDLSQNIDILQAKVIHLSPLVEH